METCRKILVSGLQELGLSRDEDKVKALLAFIGLIEKWNRTYNLTSIRNRENMVRLHILDSLAILPWLQGPGVIDIGTGAGLPGIPLAIFASEFNFVLLDGNAKKTRFVQQVVLETGLKNVTVCHSRVEDYQPEIPFNTITTRAFSDLYKMLDLSRHLLAEKGILLAMKGRRPEQELQKISLPYSIFAIKVPGVEVGRCLIQVEKNYG